MLAPNAADAVEKLTDAYSGIVATDALAQSCQSIQIVPILDEPAWLLAVRGQVQQLDAAADAWQQDRAAVWAPVVLGFEEYFAIFSGVAQVDLSTHKDAAFWIDLLSDTLLPAVNKSLASTQGAERELKQRYAAFSAVLPQLDKSIAAGWSALASEERAMLRLTEQLGELTQSVQALGDKMTSDAIASDRGIAQTSVSMLYAAGSAGVDASVPILGMVVAVVTIGKSFYDLVEDDNQLIAELNEINTVKAQLSDDALGVALTKSTLQTLYSVEKQYLAVNDALPGLVDLWTTEQAKVQDAIEALRSGAQPDQYLDIITLPQALGPWQAINTFVGEIAKADMTVGEPVTIDIAKAQIRPTLATPSRP